jgi:hypothetical protein
MTCAFCELYAGRPFDLGLDWELVPPDPRAVALPWLFSALLVTFTVRATGCANYLPGEDMAETREWKLAVNSWNATFLDQPTGDCTAPQLEYVDTEEFADRCEHAACSDAPSGRCAHACTHLLQPQALVIADAGRGENFGRWVLVHESLHVLAQCAGRYADGDAAHSNPLLWGAAMTRAMSEMEREPVPPRY